MNQVILIGGLPQFLYSHVKPLITQCVGETPESFLGA